MNFADMWDVISKGGPLALAVVFLWLFQSRKILSEKQLSEVASVYKDMVAEKDKEIEWLRQAFQQQAERGDKQEAANREQIEVAKAALVVLNGVREAAKQVNP